MINNQPRLNDYAIGLSHTDHSPTLQESNTPANDKDTKKSATKEKYPLDNYLFDTELQRDRVSSLVSSVSPALSPETLDALQNAERLVKDAQRQVIEMSFNALNPVLETIKENTAQPVLDDNLLYLRELVESKFQEANNPMKIHDRVGENQTHPDEKSLINDQIPVRLSAYRSNKGTKFKKIEGCIEETSKITSRKSPFKNGKLFFDEAYNQVKTRYPPYVDIFPHRVIRNQQTVETEIFSSSNDVQDTNIGVFDNDTDQSNVRFRVQEGPKVNIERKLTIQNTENIHISPDSYSLPVYNNVATYQFQHESFMDKTASKNREELREKPKERNDATSSDNVMKVNVAERISEEQKLPNVTTRIAETFVKRHCRKKESFKQSLREKSKRKESIDENKNGRYFTTEEGSYEFKSKNFFDEKKKLESEGSRKNEVNNEGVKNTVGFEKLESSKLSSNLQRRDTDNDYLSRDKIGDLTKSVLRVNANSKKDVKIRDRNGVCKSETLDKNNIRKNQPTSLLADDTSQQSEDEILSNKHIYGSNNLQDEEEYDLEDINLTPPCIADFDTVLRVYDKSIEQIIQRTAKLSGFISQHTTLKVTSDNDLGEHADNKNSSNIIPINNNKITSLNLINPSNEDQIRKKHEQSIQFKSLLESIDTGIPIDRKLEENKHMEVSTLKIENEKNRSFLCNTNGLNHSTKQRNVHDLSVNHTMLVIDASISTNSLSEDVKNDYFDQDTNSSSTAHNFPSVSQCRQVVQHTRPLSASGTISSNVEHLFDVQFPRNQELVNLQDEDVQLFDYSKNDEIIEESSKDRNYCKQEKLPKVSSTKGNVNLPGTFTAPLNAHLQLENIYGREIKPNIDSSCVDVRSNKGTEFDSCRYLFLHSGQEDIDITESKYLQYKRTNSQSKHTRENEEVQVLETSKHSSKDMQQFVIWLFEGKEVKTDDDIVNVLREAAIDPITVKQFIALLSNRYQKINISLQDLSENELRLTLKDWQRIYDFVKYVMDFTGKKANVDDLDTPIMSKIDKDLSCPGENCDKQYTISEICTKLIKVREHERERKTDAKFITNYEVFDDHQKDSEKMNDNAQDKAIQCEVFANGDKRAHSPVGITKNNQDTENKVTPANSNVDSSAEDSKESFSNKCTLRNSIVSEKLIVKEVSEDLTSTPMETNSTKSTSLNISDADSATFIHDMQKENSLLASNYPIDRLDSPKSALHSEIDSIIREDVTLQECTDHKACYSYSESDKHESDLINTSSNKSTLPTFNEQLEVVRGIDSTNTSPEHVMYKIGMNNKEYENNHRDLVSLDNNMYNGTSAVKEVLKSKSSMHAPSHDLYKNETSSETYSEGEVCLPSSSSYSLGEVRISGSGLQCNTIEHKTIKSTENMATTRSTLNVSSKGSSASDFGVYSFGEVYGAELECIETLTEITSDGEQRP